MSEPFISEIRIFGFNYAPRNWATCDGQLIPVTQNESLYSLIGTRYGGDGITNFALPDLRGRAPLHRSDAYPQGYFGGAESVALQETQIPTHTHNLMADATANATTNEPANNSLSKTLGTHLYADPATPVPMHPNSIGTTGANYPHNNMQPSLVLNFCIALSGVFPSRS